MDPQQEMHKTIVSAITHGRTQPVLGLIDPCLVHNLFSHGVHNWHTHDRINAFMEIGDNAHGNNHYSDHARELGGNAQKKFRELKYIMQKNPMKREVVNRKRAQ